MRVRCSVANVLETQISSLERNNLQITCIITKKAVSLQSIIVFMSNLEDKIYLYEEDSIMNYQNWATPTVIVSDGPYGVKGFKGDLFSTVGLAEWYEPHIAEWSKYATAHTTLWFWCTEQGWATVHPILLKYGWEFKSCNVWNKGMSHVAGNVNTKTISHLPVVTEVCVQYTKKPTFTINGKEANMMEWLRYEWGRTGLPFNKTNIACGVKDAATRKYFTTDPCLWYMPPTEQFVKIADYANTFGKEKGKPYFSLNGETPLTADEWSHLRPIFKCPMGTTNVWDVPQLRDKERIKTNQKAVHLNQKPLKLISTIIEISSEVGDVVWDPFGGLFTTAIACFDLKRRCYSSEISPETYKAGERRVANHIASCKQQLFYGTY